MSTCNLAVSVGMDLGVSEYVCWASDIGTTLDDLGIVGMSAMTSTVD